MSRNGLSQTIIFPRCNPQGFNKRKVNKPELKSMKLDYPILYRPAVHLSTSYANGEPRECEDEVDENFEYIYSKALRKRQLEYEMLHEKRGFPPIPKVNNPFDFPQLVPEWSKVAEAVYEIEQEVFNVEECDEYEEQAQDYSQMNPFEQFVIDFDDPIFRTNYPEVVIDPNFVIPSPVVKSLDKKLTIAVRVTNVYSPSQFWFQYGFESLQPLMGNLQDFYSSLPENDLIVSMQKLIPGFVVAAEFFGIWHRAQIVDEPNLNGDTNLLIIDFAITAFVHKSHIRYLLKHFTNDPKKALRGSMVGACPKNDNDEWSMKSRKRFFDMVSGKKCYATIRSYRDDDDVFEMDISEQADTPVNCAQLLVFVGLADSVNISESNAFAMIMPFANQKARSFTQN